MAQWEKELAAHPEFSLMLEPTAGFPLTSTCAPPHMYTYTKREKCHKSTLNKTHPLCTV